MKRWYWMAAVTGALIASTAATALAAPNRVANPARTDSLNRAGANRADSLNRASGMNRAGAALNGPRPAARMAMNHPILAALARLDLTPAQKNRIKGFVQTAQQNVLRIRQNTALTPAQKQARVRMVRQNLERQVRSVLTPAQRQKLVAILRRERMMVGLAAVLQRLNLAPDQKTQVQNLIKDARAKARIIRQSNISEQDKRTQLRTLMQSTRKNVVAVLTPEQRRQLEKMMRQRRNRA